MCDFKLKGAASLPAFDVPPGFTIESYFEKVTRDGFAERCTALEPLAEAGRLRYPLAVYEARLDKEIGVIRRVGFAGYFLIVWDFIRYAREQGVPVGPGRGSAAGRLVAYCLRITDIDPIEYDLIFERFLNEERISPPTSTSTSARTAAARSSSTSPASTGARTWPRSSPSGP